MRRAADAPTWAEVDARAKNETHSILPRAFAGLSMKTRASRVSSTPHVPTAVLCMNDNKREKNSQIAHPVRKGEQIGSPLAGPAEQLGVEFLLVVPRLPGNLLLGVG